jgi:prepilin-type N-terminal cleavage/methylation domain-containing protein
VIRNHRAGFTLLEVMLALVILAVGLTAIAQSVMMVMRSSALTSRYTQASILAQNKLEEVLNRTEGPKSEEKGEFEEQPGFTWRVIPEKGAVENIPQIRVEVSFPAPGGSRFVEYTAFKANRTPPPAPAASASADKSKDAKATKDDIDATEEKESTDTKKDDASKTKSTDTKK